ncbi:MAG TPA: hypothetical protein VGR89_16460, partial [Puia sp.]|nr:hypothetical protein [Puia sp.]
MDRRKSIKTILIGTVSAGALAAEACHTSEKNPAASPGTDSASAEGKSAASLNPSGYNRMKEEIEHMKDLAGKTF